MNSFKVFYKYLEFIFTEDFQKWASDTKLTLIMNSFIAADKACFNLTELNYKREKIILIYRIIFMYQNSDILWILLIIYSLDNIKSEKNASFLSYFYIVYRIIQIFSEYFSDSYQKSHACSKNIYYTVYLLKYLIKIADTAQKSNEK